MQNGGENLRGWVGCESGVYGYESAEFQRHVREDA